MGIFTVSFFREIGGILSRALFKINVFFFGRIFAFGLWIDDGSRLIV